MGKHNRTSALRLTTRTAIAAAASLLMASAAMAQSSEGSIYGTAKAEAAVVVKNLDTNQSRTVKADSNGSFNFSKLPPGRYVVTANGITREVAVQIGSGTQVSLAESNQLETVTIQGRATRTKIDLNTSEVNSVFTSQQIAALPVSRNVNAVAYLAPGVVQGDDGLGDGKLPSFAGASVGENGYYINGFDVTNIRNFLSYANLPFEAIAEQQVKSGGYGAEYGRSLGGVVSLVTKRGTNEWKSGGAVYFSPAQLRSKGQNVLNKEPAGPNLPPEGYTLFQRDDKRDLLSYNVFTGGPIIKDKLFVFALVEGREDVTTNFEATRGTRSVSNKPNGMIKVDFAPNEMFNFELTAVSNKERYELSDYQSARPYSTSLDGTAQASQQTQGGNVVIGKATAYLTDNLTVSALVGTTENQRLSTTGARAGNAESLKCPPVADTPTTFTEIGCWGPPYNFVGVRDPLARPVDTDKRKAGRLDLEYTLGNHTIRAGLDNQKFTSYEAGTAWQGDGYYYRYFIVPASGRVNGVAGFTPGSQYVRRQQNSSTSGEFEVVNNAVYLEDSWKINKQLLVYGGLRSESFNNKNADGVSFVKADNLLAPRFGVSWDLAGDGSTKVFTNIGRYYIPVAANTNIRATRSESFIREFFTFASRDSKTQAPVGLGASIGSPQIIQSGNLPDPGTIADTKLKPMNQDEFMVGIQKSLNKEWTLGAKYTHRKINDGMDDFCGHYAMENYAADKGYTDAFSTIGLAQCIIVNPGRDVTLKMDLKGDGNLVTETIPASYLGLAKYERLYDGLELTLDRPFDGKWGLNASYTLSKSRGSAEGYVQSNLNQEDAGITQDFDYGSFTHGAFGPLPNDRRHVIKVYGNYALSDTLRVGLNTVLASGRPKSCIGFVPDTVADYAESKNYTSASSYYCGGKLSNRGSAGRTPWTSTFDLQLAYTPKLEGKTKLTLQADVFNIFNSQGVTETNEVGDYARNDTRASLNYGNPSAFQSPRSVRLSARIDF